MGKDNLYWIGSEIAYVHNKSIYNDAEWDNPSSNGFSVGGLMRYRLPIEQLNVSAFTGLSYVYFGDFKVRGYIVESRHGSIQFRLGIDIELPFFE